MRPSSLRRETGFVLLTSLILLAILVIVAGAMLRSVNLHHRITGVLRDKQVALTSAVAAERYAEWWLTQSSPSPIVCTSVQTMVTASVCSNALVNPNALPWVALDGSGTSHGVGISYAPPTNVLSVNAAGGANQVYASPGFYIVPLPGGTSNTTDYQINAYGYGGAQDSVAVVQSTVSVTTGYGSPESSQQ